MLTDEQVRVLTARLQAHLEVIGARAAVATTRAWDELGTYDRDSIETFTRRVAPTIAGSKTAAANTATGYYSTLLAVRPPAINVARLATLFVPAAGFLAYWHALKEGRDHAEALSAGRSMVEAATSNAVVSTARRTGDAVAAATGQRTAGWRRVLDGKACEWCQVVSTQRYRTAESADFGHDRCGCTAVPIIGDRDPGRVVNRQLLDELKAAGAVDRISATRR